jgi:hypothetical protein
MAGEDLTYVRWLGQGKCCAPGCSNMSGPPHHPRHSVGMALRAHDHRAVPLCPPCHVSIHSLTWGTFKGWVKQQVRDFLDDQGEKFRTQFLQGVNSHESTEFPR